ncbi:histidine kinase [uncultured Shewanella sp.]|uniref:tetratricopeptide repeat-containing diguanylate cyclase n=1 Tax=uncultured Shewanella sp. TaxID=173975 RepID=UPI002636E7A3|nr:histidine kinase [uncultured Shewanella sp.]
MPIEINSEEINSTRNSALSSEPDRIIHTINTFLYNKPEEPLNRFNTLLYQYPNQVLATVEHLEKKLSQNSLSDNVQLRINLLKCNAYLQVGENEAALNLAKLSDTKIKSLKHEQAKPYFMLCMAEAYANLNNIQLALPLLYSAITLAQQDEQPQALISGLWLRSRLDSRIENFDPAKDDLTLALDLYSEIEQQHNPWSWPPKAYLYASMAKLHQKTGQTEKAEAFMLQALNSPHVTGKIALNLALDMAKITLENKQEKKQRSALKQARLLLPELGSELELAYAYSQIAYIDFHTRRFDSATQLLNLSIKTFTKRHKTIENMRAKCLLAQVKLTRGIKSEGIKLMLETINMGIQHQFYQDLEQAYRVLSQYYAENGQFERAFYYQEQRFETQKNENDYIKRIWLLQLKTDVSRQEALNASKTPQPIKYLKTSFILPQSGYIITVILLLILLPIIIYKYFSKTSYIAPNIQTPEKSLTALSVMEQILSLSKQDNTPLSLLLFNPSHIHKQQAPNLTTILKQLLREQDKVIQHNHHQLLIMLPHTSEKGALNVIQQLTDLLSPWQENHKVHIGLSTMQQFDNLESMIKRASINLLSKIKSN